MNQKITPCFGAIMFILGIFLIAWSSDASSGLDSFISDLYTYNELPYGGIIVPWENLNALDSYVSFYEQQISSLYLFAGIAVMISAIAIIIIGIAYSVRQNQKSYTSKTKPYTPRTVAPNYSRQPEQVVKETTKEKEIVYNRCTYCGAKVLETERQCPNCGAEL
jgi:uncharacterized membrane protein